MNNKFILIIVPGKDDRAFYKTFFWKVFKNQDLEIIDIDRDEYRQEKYRVMSQAFQIGATSPIRGSSVLRINLDEGKKAIYLIIWPAGGNVVERACEIIEYQSGLSSPTIDYLVVAEDAEEMGFEERLNSLENSLNSHGCTEIKERQQEGRHYRLYILRKPKNVRLILLVQGIDKSLDQIDKHTIEDYILYPHSAYIQEIKTNYPELFNKILRSRHAHKKMALLIAIYMCYKTIEEAFFNALNEEELDVLIKSNDGLATLIEIITRIIKNYN